MIFVHDFCLFFSCAAASVGFCQLSAPHESQGQEVSFSDSGTCSPCTFTVRASSPETTLQNIVQYWPEEKKLSEWASYTFTIALLNMSALEEARPKSLISRATDGSDKSSINKFLSVGMDPEKCLPTDAIILSKPLVTLLCVPFLHSGDPVPCVSTCAKLRCC